jgi:predicted porin
MFHMKKSLLALALLGVFAGAASAQSSVTMYGRVDLSLAKKSGSDQKEVLDGSAGRIGVRGVEDLGGGLQAIFNIEHRFFADTGSIAVPARFWQGRSVVGLQGGFGLVTLGREYTNAFVYTQNVADPWGHDTVVARDDAVVNGLTGLSGTLGVTTLGIGQRRLDNSITYRLSMSGFNFGIQTGAAQDPGDITIQNKRPINFGVAYISGPITVGGGYERTGFEGINPLTGDSERGFVWGLHGAYDFGVVKPGLMFLSGTTAFGQDRRSFAGTLTAPLGAGQVKAILGRVQVKPLDAFSSGWSSVNTLVGLGYHYSLSKRTTVYVDYVRNTGAFLTSKNGYDFGLKHNF